MHYRQVCQYGYTHGQCRCSSETKITKTIDCNMDMHRPWFVVAYGSHKRWTMEDSKTSVIGMEDLLPNFKTMKEAIDFARHGSNGNGFRYHVFRMPKIGKK